MLPNRLKHYPQKNEQTKQKGKKPNALINALPTPLVSFALVRISPSANSTSLSPHRPPNVFHAPASPLHIAQPTSYHGLLSDLL